MDGPGTVYYMWNVKVADNRHIVRGKLKFTICAKKICPSKIMYELKINYPAIPENLKSVGLNGDHQHHQTLLLHNTTNKKETISRILCFTKLYPHTSKTRTLSHCKFLCHVII